MMDLYAEIAIKAAYQENRYSVCKKDILLIDQTWLCCDPL